MFSVRMRKMVGSAIVFAGFLICVPAFAQTGGLEGKCTGDGGKPLVGYTLTVERVDVKWTSKTKTNKKGEYIYIGLTPGNYKVTLMDLEGKPLLPQSKTVGLGDPTELNFDVQKAREETQKAQESNPEYQKQVQEQKQSASLKQVFDQARALYVAKQYTEAAAVFEKALPLAKGQNLGIVMGQLADTWAKAGNAETNPDIRKQDQAKALDYYQKVIANAPNDAGIHNNLGSLYSEMGKSAEAGEEFKKAAELDPTHASSYYYNLGAILVNQSHMDEAAVALKKATDIDPNNANAWYWYGTALMGKATLKPDGTMDPAPGTIEAFQTYLKLAPTGQYATAAQGSIQALSTKADLVYKAPKKTKK